MKLETVFDTDDEAQFLYTWFFKRDKVQIDNIVFYLHYHVTTALFFVGCLIVTVGMYIMDPIDCIADKAVDDVIDNFCLYHSTYSISGGHRYNLSVHPGVAASPAASQEDSKFHHYYLWVALMLAIQASFFYIKRGIWKGWEESRVEMILDEKSKVISQVEEQEENNHANATATVTQKWQRLASYILSRSHKAYYWKLLFCELLNLVIAIGQLTITDVFLGFGLSQLNLDFLQLIEETRPFERTDMVELMFPKVSTCTFLSYGPSGNVINYEALCVLPVNALNEKIFGVIYIWLLLLIAISSLAVLYRLLFLSSAVRKAILKMHLNPAEIISGNLQLNDLKDKHLGIGNWQLLCQLGGNSNIDSWELTKIVMHICEL